MSLVAAAGLPILAECGGLLLLGEQLHDGQDQPQPTLGTEFAEDAGIDGEERHEAPLAQAQT